MKIVCGVDGIDKYEFGDKSNRVWVLEAFENVQGSFVRSFVRLGSSCKRRKILRYERRWRNIWHLFDVFV